MARRAEAADARRGSPVVDADADPPECTACGACCFSEAAEYVRVFEVDLGRMDRAALGLTRSIEGRVSMRMAEGRCAALATMADGRFACAVYEARPDCCRALERGGSACRAAREERARRERRA